jgi:hypothetical protein
MQENAPYTVKNLSHSDGIFVTVSPSHKAAHAAGII